MAAATKNQKIELLAKLVQKRCRGAGLTNPPERSVLETIMYAALLENSTFDKADAAFAFIKNYYIDWNEIRVCSNRELADTLTDLPNPTAAAERVRKALQGIFEKRYTFDLEEVRRKGKALADHIQTLESLSAGTPYMIQYVAQVALDGHLIPLDEASLRIMRRLGLSQITSDGLREVCNGLDRVILKKSSLTFATQLHHFAAGYFDVPDSPELLSQLSAIDREAVNRSWVAPILASTKPTPTQDIEKKPETPPRKTTKPKAKPSPKSAPVKPNAISASKTKSKSLPAKPVAKETKKPNKPKVDKKKPPKKVSKGVASKSSVSKKPAKPMPSKKKPTPKKGPAKPVKKPKVASPSKAL